MATNAGTRKRPMQFQTLQAASEYSVKYWLMIWAKVGSRPGVFQIYPGGRTVHYGD